MQTYNKDLKNVLSSIGPQSCPYVCNFHTHTIHSDGSLEPLDLLSQAIEYKLSHLAITDHHNIKAYYESVEWIEHNLISSTNTLNLWSGVEISCLLDRCLVHILGLGFDVNHTSMRKYIKGMPPVGDSLNAKHVVESIHEAKGIAILAHPARYRIGFEQLIESAVGIGIDGGEAWYDYDYSEVWSPSNFICSSVEKKLQEHGLLMTCGTDTHGTSILGR